LEGEGQGLEEVKLPRKEGDWGWGEDSDGNENSTVEREECGWRKRRKGVGEIGKQNRAEAINVKGVGWKQWRKREWEDEKWMRSGADSGGNTGGARRQRITWNLMCRLQSRSGFGVRPLEVWGFVVRPQEGEGAGEGSLFVGSTDGKNN